MRKMNPFEKYIIGNIAGFAFLLLASANENYHWLSLWYSVIGYTTGMITFMYVIFFALPSMKRWLDTRVDELVPPAEKK